MGSIFTAHRRLSILSVALLALPLSPGETCEDASEVLGPLPADQVRALLADRYAWFSVEELDEISDVIVAEALAADLDPELVAAVIDVESSGNRFAVSRVGAMGLMQLLPNTAESVAKRAGVDWQGPETLFDPVANVRLGVSYLDELVDRFGDIEVALTAYNWGPTRIARRLREGGQLPVQYTDRVLGVYETLI